MTSLSTIQHRRALALAACALAVLLAGCAAGGADDRTDNPRITAASVADFARTDEGCTAMFTNDIDTAIERDDAGGAVVTYSRNVSLPDAGHALGEPSVEALNGSAFAFDVPVEATDEPAADCAADAYARYNATIRLPSSGDGWRLVVRHGGERVGTVAGGTDGGTASARTGGSAAGGGAATGGGDADAASDGRDATDDADAGFAVRIEGGDRTLDADASGEATVELRYASSGGTVRETSWDAIESPSGSSTGVLDYDSYAELQLRGAGEYVVQLTATSADGERAHDTVTLTVR